MYHTNTEIILMDNTIKAALITGVLGIIGTIIGAQYGEKYAIIQVNSQVETEIDKNESLSINNVDDLISEYNKLVAENISNEKYLDSQNSYNELDKEYKPLQQLYSELEEKNKSLEEDILNNYTPIEEYSKLQQSYGELEEKNKSLQRKRTITPRL